MPFFELITGELSVSFELVAGLFTGYTTRKTRPSKGVEVDVAEGRDAIHAVAADWRNIENAGGAATPFQTLALGETAAAVHLRRGETPRIVVVRGGGRPTALFPTVVVRCAGVRAIRFLGDPLNQYGDILATPDATHEHIEAAWRAAAEPAVAKFAHLRKVRGDAWLAPLLDRRATAVAECAAPFVTLDHGGVSARGDMRKLRRWQRRLAEYGAVRFEILRGREARPALREALELKRGWLAQRGLRSRVVGDPDWEDGLMMLAADVGSGSPLAVARLSAGGQTVAVEIGFVDDRRWCSFLGAYAPSFARAGPGHVQIAEAIAHCVACGITIYDLLPPADAYKHDIASGTMPVRDYAVTLGASGHAAMLATRAVPTIKSMVERLPTALRRMMIARSP